MSMLRRTLPAFVLALAFVTAAFLVSTEPRTGGGRSLEAFWLMVAGFAVLPLAAIDRLGRPLAGWSALFVASVGAWCALTKSTWLFYLYLRPWELLQPERALGVAVVLVQAIAVVVALRRPAGRALLRAWCAKFDRRLVLASALALVATGVQLTLVYPHRDEPRYLVFLAAQYGAVALMVLLNLLHLGLLAAAAPENLLERGAAFLRAAEEGQGAAARWRARLPFLCAVWVTLVSALIAWFAFDRVPHVPDGLAYLFQARTIAGGSFAAPAPPVPEAFRVYLMDVRDGQWFAVTNPGFPLLLALGFKVGLGWLVNPVLGGLTILAGHGLLRRLLDRRAADIGTLLLAFSPWLLFLSASLMTHMATQLFALCGFILVLEARSKRRADLSFLGGAAFGFVFLVRPLDGLLLGLAAGLFMLVGWWRELRPRFTVMISFALGAVAVSSVLLLFSESITGSYVEPPINAYIAELWPGSTNRLGFGPEVGNPPGAWGPLDPIPGHGWRDVLLNTNQNLANLQMELFGWPLGSLVFIIFLLARGRLDARGRGALALLLLLLVGYNLYWFSGGPDFGPRYWFSMLLPLVMLTIQGFDALRRHAGGAVAGRRVGLALIALVLLAAPVFCAWRICGRYLEYRGFHGGYRKLVEENDLAGALVFVTTPEEVDYGCAFILNDPFLDPNSTVFARDRGKEANFELMRAMKSRRVFWVEGRAITGGAVRFVDPRGR